MKTIQKYICFILLIILLFCGWLPSGFASSDSINWYTYDEGIVLRKIEKKKIFLHFWAEWCKYCAKMAKVTFKDPKVITYLNKNFISIKIDIEKEHKIASNYNIIGLPVTWFISENGEEISDLPGYVPPEKLIEILKYVHTDSYKNMTLKNFSNKNK